MIVSDLSKMLDRTDTSGLQNSSEEVKVDKQKVKTDKARRDAWAGPANKDKVDKQKVKTNKARRDARADTHTTLRGAR